MRPTYIDTFSGHISTEGNLISINMKETREDRKARKKVDMTGVRVQYLSIP
jgi:hypothetical protein